MQQFNKRELDLLHLALCSRVIHIEKLLKLFTMEEDKSLYTFYTLELAEVNMLLDKFKNL